MQWNVIGLNIYPFSHSIKIYWQWLCANHYTRSWNSVINNRRKISVLTEFVLWWMVHCPSNINWRSSYTFWNKENTCGRIYFSKMAPPLSPTFNKMWLWYSSRTGGLVGWPIHPGLPGIFLALPLKALCPRNPSAHAKQTDKQKQTWGRGHLRFVFPPLNLDGLWLHQKDHACLTKLRHRDNRALTHLEPGTKLWGSAN